MFLKNRYPATRSEHPDYPAQTQLLFPLLDTLDAEGGRTSAATACRKLATTFNIDRDKEILTLGSGSTINGWDRHVRWTRQQAVEQGLLQSPERNIWEITPQGKDTLLNARPGLVITIYESEKGVILWGCAESVANVIAPESVSLILTSPPYPLLRKKDYGNMAEGEHVEWLVTCAAQWKDLLKDNASLVLNLGDTWQRGQPTLSLYQERLLLRLCDDIGYHLAQRFYWENPSKMPAPAEWVTIRRIRVKPSVEQIYWLSKTPMPEADNRRVLRAYSQSMKRLLDRGGMDACQRPSGYSMAHGAFSNDIGGSIPGNLLTIPNTSSSDDYLLACKNRSIQPHPARFPSRLPAFFINLLTGPVILYGTRLPVLVPQPKPPRN